MDKQERENTETIRNWCFGIPITTVVIGAFAFAVINFGWGPVGIGCAIGLLVLLLVVGVICQWQLSKDYD